MIRLLAFSLSMVLSVSVAHADIDGGGYGERRVKADSDVRTLKARSEFDRKIQASFQLSKSRTRTTHLRLTMNPRMIAQYGRGAQSAHDVLPGELDQILNMISESRTKLDYWGYIGRTLRLPVASNGTLTFFAKWNERDSRYEAYTPSHLRGYVVLGLLHSQRKSKSWFSFF